MTSNPLDVSLSEKGYLVVDGGLASELESAGFPLRDSLWSARALIEQPELIQRVHASYLEAGADILVTSSYQATYEGFAQHGYSPDDTSRYLGRSLQLARSAIQQYKTNDSATSPMVAASIGSYGAFLHNGSEYRGHFGLSQQELARFHKTRVEVIAAHQPDLIAFETIPSLLEARALTSLLRADLGSPAWMSFTFQNPDATPEGDAVEACAALAQESEHIVAVGMNCTSPDHCTALLQKMRKETHKPLIVCPNRGEPWDHASGEYTQTKCRPLGDYRDEFLEAGATLLGGCCRTTPADIHALAAQRALP